MRNLTCFLLALVLAAPSTARAQYFEHDPDDPKQNAPIREGERAGIPLDTVDPAYNLWQTTRSTSPILYISPSLTLSVM